MSIDSIEQKVDFFYHNLFLLLIVNRSEVMQFIVNCMKTTHTVVERFYQRFVFCIYFEKIEFK